MVNIPELRACMARKGYNQKKLAKELGISEPTMIRRFKDKTFNYREIERIIQILDIQNPVEVFFGS